MELFIASLRKSPEVDAVIVNTEPPVPQLAVLGSGKAGKLITIPVIIGFWDQRNAGITNRIKVRIRFINLLLNYEVNLKQHAIQS